MTVDIPSMREEIKLVCPACRGGLAAGVEGGPSPSRLVCSSCGRGYAAEQGVPVLLPEDEKGPGADPFRELYEDVADRKGDMADFYRHYAPERKLHELLAAAPARKVRALVDLGCGDGVVLEAMRRRIGANGNAPTLVGVDLSLKRAVRTRERAGARVYVGDIGALPFASGQFDLTICSEVIEHVPKPEAAVREISRVTRDGGVALLSVPMAGWRRSLVARSGRQIPYLDPEEHLREYSVGRIDGFVQIREFFAQLARAGLDPVLVRGAYFYELPILERVLDRFPTPLLRKPAAVIDRLLGLLPGVKYYGRYLIVRAVKV